MLDTIHLYSAVCQIYLNETEQRQNFFKPNTKKTNKRITWRAVNGLYYQLNADFLDTESEHWYY